MMILLQLFWEFLKIGLFSVGRRHGHAALFVRPFRQHRLVYLRPARGHARRKRVHAWPCGNQHGNLCGLYRGGFGGAVLATLGTILPGTVIVLIIASMLDKFRGNKYVDAAFYGLRPASTGLIAAAGVSVVGIALLNTELYAVTGKLTDLVSIRAVILAVALWVLTNVVKPTKKLHPVVFIALSAVVGIVFSFAGA